MCEEQRNDEDASLGDDGVRNKDAPDTELGDGPSMLNETGAVNGPVVQAGAIYGGVQITSGPSSSSQSPTEDPWTSAKTIIELTGRDLGVHKSIDIESALLDGPPLYIPRSHDQDLQKALSGPFPCGRMVVLFGESATGKTRTAYEALHAVEQLRTWPVMRPTGPDHLLELLCAPAPPRHVLWLDDLYIDYLDTKKSVGIVDRLRLVLQRPSPFLVIADMWTSHWNELRRRQGGSTRASLAGKLFDEADVVEVRLPLGFAEVDPDELDRFTARDPRLALAHKTAGDGLPITQVLSGGPQLLDIHLETAHSQPVEHAVITATMDARRLGHLSPLPPEVLWAGVAGYLTDEQRLVGKKRFGKALKRATRKHRGIAALTPRPTTPGLRASADGYVLHDFLHQHAVQTRAAEPCPESLWNALVDHTSDVDDLERLAADAQRRGLYNLAARFAARAAALNSPEAMRLLAWLHDLRTAAGEADGWRARADSLDPSSWEGPPIFLEDLQESEDGLRERAERGDREAMRVLADDLMPTRAEEAVLWARRAADGGTSESMIFLARILRHAGYEDEKKQVLLSSAEAGNTGAMLQLDLDLTRRGEHEEALHWARAHAETGNPLGVSRLATVLQRRGDHTAAEELLRRHAEAGSTPVMWHLGQHLANTDRVEEAVTWFQRSAADDLLAVNLIVNKFQELHRLVEAEKPLRVQHDRGKWIATRKLVELLELLDRYDEAETLLRRLVEVSSHPTLGIHQSSAMEKLIEFLRGIGRTTEAERLRMYGIEPGGVTSQAFDLPSPLNDQR
ncbi:hypothetical protein B0I31_113167 [Saccharothrix carnea]|uniref:TPR repeat protein n=2 Tax=Saccharothrix carnea TaxID=1280637 RepID=A0A2P8I202_SACCR|nr:hypothetical protein B0I31_113167 [Saccharothrix carnea]